MKPLLVRLFSAKTVFTMLALTSTASLVPQRSPRPVQAASAKEICSIFFAKDPLRPARVENSALPCLKKAAWSLRADSATKLVLVGAKDTAQDHEPSGAGSDREEEDASGFDVRLEDLSAYRAVNAKWYLGRYLHASAGRILPTTDETYFAQTVTIYLVPAAADFNHNFLGTTKINEKPCTITPCYSSDEETLTPQRRPRILEGAVDGSPAEIAAERKELAALHRYRHTYLDMDGSENKVALTPLPARPTPDHPATTSIIPR